MTRWIFLTLVLMQQPETMSLLGEPLYARKLGKADRAKAEAELTRAHAVYTSEPSAPEAILALAQAHVALGRIGDALVILTHGIEVNRDDPTLHLERGRGYILIRKFDPAERDLKKAADKNPSARCALGLAQYLSGEYERARASYADCQDPGIFGYLAERRTGRTAGKAPTPDGPLPSSSGAITLPGTVASKRVEPRQPIAASYLTAIERLLAGDEASARDRLKTIVEKNRNDWMEPAYIAAEADYAKLGPKKKKGKR